MKKTLKVILTLLTITVLAFCFCSCEDSADTNGKTYTITVVNGTGGGSYEQGASVTVTAETKDGKTFVSRNEGETVVSTENPYTFKAEKDITLTAVYSEEKCTVTVENGTGSGEFVKGATATVSANDVQGKRFSCWKVNGEVVSTDKEYSFKVDSDITLVAEYVNVYTITVAGGTGSGEYAEGTEVTVIADAVEGKRFVCWKNGVITLGEEATYTFKVTKDITVTAEYVNVYTVTVTGGTGSGEYAEGAEVTITAAVETGKLFVKWIDGTGATISESATYKFTVTANVEYAAVFENIENFELAIDKNELFEKGSSEFDYEDNGDFRISNANLLTATVLGEYDDVEVSFVLYGADNWGNPSGNFRVYVGDYCFYYRVSYKWFILFGTGEDENNNDVSATMEYTDKIKFRMAYSDGIISLYYAKCADGVFGEETLLRSVTYTEKNVKVKISSYASCVKISDFMVKYAKPESEVKKYNVTVEGGAGSGLYKETTKVTVAATGDSDKVFVKWVDEDGNFVSADEEYTFIPFADVTLTAVYDNLIELTRKYNDLDDLGTTDAHIKVEDGAYVINSDVLTQITLPETYDNFEMTFDMFGTNNYGDPSGNFRIYIGETYSFYFRAPYHFLGLLGSGEDENNPVNYFNQQDDEKFRYRIVYKDGKLSLYYAKYTEGALGEETLCRTVDYGCATREIKFSCYKAVVKIANFTVKYIKPESEIGNYRITVEGGSGSGTYREDRKVTVVLAGDAKNFIKWVDGEGNDLSVNATFGFYPKKDMTIKAVYGAEKELTKKYLTLEDLNTTDEHIKVEDGAYVINSDVLTQITLPETYDNFEMTFDMFGTNNYGDPSGNFRIYIGETYSFYFRAPYHFLGLLGSGEDENNPVNYFNQQDDEKFRYRIVYKDGKLSLYYAKYTEGALGEETLCRTVDYGCATREIKFSCYKAVVKIANFTVKYIAVA